MGLGLSPSLKHLPGLPGNSHSRPTGCTNGGWASGPDPLPIGMGARGGTHGICHIPGSPPEQLLGWDMGQFKARGVV